MSHGLLFVTAPEADHKVINRLLLHLKDWEYGSGDRFRLVTSRSAEHLASEASTPGTPAPAPATSAPVDPDLANEWAGAGLADVESFCLALDKSGGESAKLTPFNSHLFVVLDADGLRDKTCVLAERVIDWEADPIEYPEAFNKARVPWYQIYLSWCNLDIANIGWDELMDGEQVADGEGEEGSRWWVYDDEESGEYLSDENRELRDAEIERMRSEGRA